MRGGWPSNLIDCSLRDGIVFDNLSLGVDEQSVLQIEPAKGSRGLDLEDRIVLPSRVDDGTTQLVSLTSRRFAPSRLRAFALVLV